MKELVASWIPWGYSILEVIQDWRHPAMDAFFKVFTRFGDPIGYLILLTLCYWCIDAKLARRLFFLVFVTLGINTIIKVSFAIPRPGPPRIKPLISMLSPSFPSGHAQGTIAFWGYLMTVWRRRSFYFIAFILIVLVGFSRLYLGVHFPQDVLVGWALGLLCLFVVFTLEGRWLPLFLKLPSSFQGASVLLSSLLLLLWPKETMVSLSGALFGLVLGFLCEQKWVQFSNEGASTQRALRAIGLCVVLGAWMGLKKVLPEALPFRFLRYMSVGVTVSFLMPWAFVMLGWAKKTTVATTTDEARTQ